MMRVTVMTMLKFKVPAATGALGSEMVVTMTMSTTALVAPAPRPDAHSKSSGIRLQPVYRGKRQQHLVNFMR